MGKRRNKIGEQFSTRTRSMLESPAYRVLSQSAHRLIARIELELCYHGGQENGKLPVTNEDFCEYGIHHGAIAPGIREAEALGFIKVTERGRGGNAEYRKPNLFRLTFSFTGRSDPPTDEWKRIKTREQAEAIARAARKAKDPRPVEFGHRSWRIRKQKADTGKRRRPRIPVSKQPKHRHRIPVLLAHSGIQCDLLYLGQGDPPEIYWRSSRHLRWMDQPLRQAANEFIATKPICSDQGRRCPPCLLG
jgi:hypothetical protein